MGTAGPVNHQAELEKMAEYRVIQRIKRFHESLKIFNGNYSDFLKILDDFEGPRGLDLNRVDRHFALEEYLSEVVRLLHNFAAAAASLIDHARKFFDEQYRDKGLFLDYQDEVDKRFKTHPLSKFVVELRQYCQHYKVPDIESNLAWSRSAPIQTSLRLTKAGLLEFRSWSAPSKAFLSTCGDKIYLKEVAQNYHQHIREFYDWFFKRLMEIHSKDVAAVEAKQKSARDEMSGRISNFLKINIDMYRKGGPGRVHDIFSPCLGPENFRELLPLETEPKKWLVKALEISQRNFNLSVDVVDQVNLIIESLPN